jgi:hypothetical protein
MVHHVTDVRYLGDYRLFLRFDDGEAGEIDMAQYLTFDGVFADLRDPRKFAGVRLLKEWGTIGWPNDVDLDPEVLYSRVTGKPLPDWASEDAA